MRSKAVSGEEIPLLVSAETGLPLVRPNHFILVLLNLSESAMNTHGESCATNSESRLRPSGPNSNALLKLWVKAVEQCESPIHHGCRIFNHIRQWFLIVRYDAM